MRIKIQQPVTTFHHVARQLSGPLKKLGIATVADLVEYYPFRYADFSHLVPLDQITAGEVVTIQGQVARIKSYRSWKRHLLITEAAITDGQHTITVRWFNQPFVTRTIKVG
ncbi:MAG: DNA helicase RecG, partial [Patescibacteria group bacterium]